MAKPIRNTPILIGEDASAFIQMAENPIIDKDEQLAERLRIESSLCELEEFIASLQ